MNDLLDVLYSFLHFFSTMLGKGALVVWLEDNIVHKKTLTRNLYTGNSKKIVIHLF